MFWKWKKAKVASDDQSVVACTACPSVVIDESLIRASITRSFAYRGVLGPDHDDKTQLDLFKI